MFDKESAKSFGQFLISKEFLKHVGTAFLFFTVIMLFSGWFLKVFTLHNTNNTVPDFRGLTKAEAIQMANDKDMECIITDSIYNARGKRGTIVEQNPPAGYLVKPGRKIFLTMKAFMAEQVAIPNLKNVSLQQARAELANYGLNIGKLLYTNGEFENLIAELRHNGKKLEPGTKVNKGTYIDIVLERGRENKFITLAIDLNGISLKEARNRCLDVFLNLGGVRFDETVKTAEDTLNAVIFKQVPDISDEIVLRPGDKIDVYLTVDKVKAIAASKRESANINLDDIIKKENADNADEGEEEDY